MEKTKEEVNRLKEQLMAGLMNKEMMTQLLQECDQKRAELQKDIKTSEKKKLDRDTWDNEQGTLYK